MIREFDYDIAETQPLKNPVKSLVAFSDGDNITEYSPFDLANTCYELWAEFIKSRNL